ncbi:putative enzyme related to lactoylglutathione lyase [Aeromicrobium panaciterrae]|uniref:Enzyme related to lactoylglutathione lyase n=1 Tax=Aeromicrobium panaciterrae TaxID=363861 RepID=A0ABU1UNB4_9ACTN|nr:VOC family protein [Aeromicrobium panaciterrae]MDR7086676.1 putative enzyme related to lactoylglutathione lyase [Aeromicrobium panaciterrae]
MTLSLHMVTVDSTDPMPLAQWWAEQLGGQIEAEMGGWYIIVGLPGIAQKVSFQKVDETTSGKNRLHLDLSTQDLEGDTKRLLDAGAGLVQEHHMEQFSWNVFTDPDGNQFCVAQA